MHTRILIVIAGVLALLFSGCRSATARARPEHPAQTRVLFFIAHDCPIANGYAPEIQRIAAQYGPRGLRCALVYAEPGLSVQAAARHAATYGYHLPITLDPRLTLAHRLGVTVTPEVVVLAPSGQQLYRGRIDDKYVSLGQPRFRVDHHDLRDALDAVTRGRPVPAPTTRAIGCFLPPVSP